MEKQLTDNSKEKKTFFKAKSSTKTTQKKNGCNRNRKQKITGDNDKLLDKNAINSSTIILTASQKYLLKELLITNGSHTLRLVIIIKLIQCMVYSKHVVDTSS